MRRRSSWRHSFWYLPQSARTLLLLFARLLSHLLLRSGRRHSVLADGAQSTRVSFAFILERYRPLPSTAFRQFAQLLERLKGCSIGCLQWETETVPANKHVTAGLLDCADSRPIAISTIPRATGPSARSVFAGRSPRHVHQSTRKNRNSSPASTKCNAHASRSPHHPALQYWWHPPLALGVAHTRVSQFPPRQLRSFQS